MSASETLTPSAAKKASILAAAIPVFGSLGFKKSSMEDIAEAAKISKQGLYLHFSGKEEIFLAAIQKYLDDGLGLVEQELARPDTPLYHRLMGAMDAWFGRHLATFSPTSFDVIEAGDRLSGDRIEKYKSTFQAKLATALAHSSEFKRAGNVCTPKEIAETLFQFGLTWKEGHPARAEFMKSVGLCIKACCQIEVHKGEI